jgi:signal peptidase II
MSGNTHSHINKKQKTFRRLSLLCSTVTVTLVLDFFSKEAVFNKMSLGESSEFIKNILWITPRLNRGAAFSFLANVENSNVLFLIAALALIPLVFYAAFGPYKKAPAWAFGLLMGGAVGNIIDRLMPLNAVRDFIDLRWWPVFNIADVAIAAGTAVLLIWSIFLDKENKHKRNNKEQQVKQ